jgi:peptidoglycan/xylan/chitin deacetylase (PgdA/CDA1 family)
MLRFCLVVDCERFLSFKQGNPRWNRFEKFKGKINDIIKNFRYNKYGFELILKIIKKNDFPITLMLVGSILKPDENIKLVEWGYHTLNHKPLTLLSDEEVKKEVKNIYNCKSITPPLWMVEDIKSPERIFKILKKEGFYNIVYKGKDDGIICLHSLEVSKIKNKYGLRCISVSNNFEGNSPKRHIKEVKADIIKNLDKDAVYLLSTHDFTHKNDGNLMEIISFIKKLEKENKLRAFMLKDV